MLNVNVYWTDTKHFQLQFGITGESYVSIAFTPCEFDKFSICELENIRNWLVDERHHLESIGAYCESGGICGSGEVVESCAKEGQDPIIRNLASKALHGIPGQEGERTSDVDASDKDSGDGWIYVVGSHKERLYKIGLTRRGPDERLNEFRPNLPFKTKLICAIRSTDVYTDEAVFHSAFSDKRTNGEWFKLDDEDLDWLRAHAEFSEGITNE